MTVTTHPRKDDKGLPVQIKKPHQASTLESWKRPDTMAVVTPDGEIPAELNGISLGVWTDVPISNCDWEELSSIQLIEEPEFDLPAGYLSAAGVVILESDGRIWVVAPSNAFAGYQATFPKGTVDSGMTLQATAMKEAFEESGMQVRLIRHLIDVKRSQSYTRYYLASRVNGNPSSMGWETQAVMLIPRCQLSRIVTHQNDASILEAICGLDDQALD